MIELAISSSGFSHLDIRGCLRKAADLGYHAVEGGYHDLFSFDRGTEYRYLSDDHLHNDIVTPAILDAQAKYGTRISGIHGPIVPLNAPDWSRRFWIYKEAFRRMRVVGATTFTIHAGGGTVVDLDREMPVMETHIAQLAEVGAESGIMVCIESGCMPYELRTPHAIAALLDRCPRLRHTADLSHFYCQRPEWDPIEETLCRMGDKVQVVHVVDWDPNQPFAHDLPAGAGIIDWQRFFRGILRKGFRGVICCENSPDAITTFLLKVRRITDGPAAVLPPSTVGSYLDPALAGRRETAPEKVLGHDPFMQRIPFGGAVIRWERCEDPWDGTTLTDQIYKASLVTIRKILEAVRQENQT